MKPDAFLPFYGSDFFQAVDGYGPAVGLGYMRALWHYWQHTHCEGLPDDDDYLRRICRCETGEWQRTKGVIFGRFFKLQGVVWHQDRCKEEYQRAERISAVRSQVGAAGAEARWQTDSKPDGKPDGKGIAEPIAKTCHSQSQSHIQSESRVTITKGPSHPTLEEVKAKAGMIGMLDAEAERFWNHFEASGWIDKNGHPIASWPAKLAVWHANNRAKPLEQAHKAKEGKGAGLTGPERISLEKELDEVKASLKALKDGATCDAWGPKYTQADKAKLAKLNTRHADIRKLLGRSG